MLFVTMLLLALTDLPTFVVAAKPKSGQEGHIRNISTISMPSGTSGTVPHYTGKGVVAHMPAAAAANITWMDTETGHDFSKRSSNCEGEDCAGVYICSEENYKGSCYWQQAGGGACHTYPYTRASSFGVDMNLQCALFEQSNCKWNQFTDITWPGLSNLYGMYTWWNSKPGSFMCRHCIGCIYGNAPNWVIN